MKEQSAAKVAVAPYIDAKLLFKLIVISNPPSKSSGIASFINKPVLSLKAKSKPLVADLSLITDFRADINFLSVAPLPPAKFKAFCSNWLYRPLPTPPCSLKTVVRIPLDEWVFAYSWVANRG